jgi:hypothetical protein
MLLLNIAFMVLRMRALQDKEQYNNNKTIIIKPEVGLLDG